MQVIFFCPLYDSYLPLARRAGAAPRIVQLHPPEWTISAAELESAFTPKTKLLVLNTPHNPTGKVFSLSELQLIADLCQRRNCLCLLDEVGSMLQDNCSHASMCYRSYNHSS